MEAEQTPPLAAPNKTPLRLALDWFLASSSVSSPAFDDTALTDDRIAALVATGLSAVSNDEVSQAVDQALAVLGLHTGVDRAFYYRIEHDTDLVLDSEWHAEGFAALLGNPSYEKLPLDLLPPRLLDALSSAGTLRLPRTRGLLNDPITDIVTPEGDRSLVLVAATRNRRLIGVAGFAAPCGTAWEERHFWLLRVVAQGVGRASEKRRDEDSLRESEARFRAICEASPLGIFLADDRGGCVYLNPQGEHILGISKEVANGTGWLRALHPEDRQRIEAGWGAAVDGREHYEAPVHRFVHENGEVRSTQVRAAKLGGGGFVGIMEDVTERLHAAQQRAELRAREEKAQSEAHQARLELANFAARISDGFVALDQEHRYVFANDRALSIVGRTRPEILGKTPWEVFPEVTDGPLHQAFLQAKSTQQPVSLENLSQRSGRWYEIRIYPSATGSSVFFEDVTDRKRSEEELKDDRDYLRQELSSFETEGQIVGLNTSLKHVLDQVQRVAPTDATVLVTGETGTGKELVARAIHDASPRKDRLLVKVNCAAIPQGLADSELFGHERGAFTGALSRRKGRFELAHGGTLFLDEVGELSLETQAKLLRVLQERELERVGGSETIRVDVRVVAATHRDLAEMVDTGRFRADLLYRLNVFPVQIPALRDRTEDIPLLVHSFVRRFAQRFGRRVDGVSFEAMQRLANYTWPGNVRELENVIERAVIVCPSTVIGLEAIPDLNEPAKHSRVSRTVESVPNEAKPGESTLEGVERAHVEQVLRETEWVIEGARGAARRLGLHPNTLRSRLKRLGLARPQV